MKDLLYAAAISAIVGILATFLPFVETFIGNLSLLDYKDKTLGYINIGAFTISLIVSLLSKGDFITKGSKAGIIIPGVIPGLLYLLYIIARSGDSLLSVVTIMGIGFYLVIIASVSILIVGLNLKTGKKSKTTFKTMKSDFVYCSKCGKKFKFTDNDDYCDECGSFLI